MSGAGRPRAEEISPPLGGGGWGEGFVRHLPLPPAPSHKLGDSHISLQPHFELPATMDGIELLHAAPEGDRPWRLVIAIPTAQAGDDPTRPGQAADRVRVLLPLGAAFERRDKRLDRDHLWLGKRRRSR